MPKHGYWRAMFSSNGSDLKTRAKLMPGSRCSTTTLPSLLAHLTKRPMPIVVPGRRTKQIRSPNNCVTATPTMPVAERRGDRVAAAFYLHFTYTTLPTDSQKRQRAGALQDASRIEKGLEHASAFGVRQSSAAFHSGPCD